MGPAADGAAGGAALRPCEVPELVPECWKKDWNAEPETRRCAACGGEAAWVGPDPCEEFGPDYYLCADEACGALTDEGGRLVPAPEPVGSTDYFVDRERENGDMLRERRVQMEQRRLDRRFGQIDDFNSW